MNTKVKVTVFAAKLRARKAALQKQRKVDLAKYTKAIEVWKLDAAALVAKNVSTIKKIPSTELRSNSGYRSPWRETIGKTVTVGLTDPPAFPLDDAIRKIDGMLKQLSITGQATISLSTDEVMKYLGGEDEE